MYKNFRIYKTDNNTFVLKADSERFGKQSIIFEHYNCTKVVEFMYENYKNKNGKIITNSGHRRSLYCKAMSTCNKDNNPWYRAE